MNPQAFVQKWKVASGLTERAACQSHFNDLCDLLGEPKPTDADPSGSWFTFEKGVTTSENRKGYADVWRRNFFGWEYKGKHKDLSAAYQQLLKYREALLNPPLLVVCDLDRFEVHTNFPNTVKQVYRFDLDALAEPASLKILRDLFRDPDQLRPGTTPAQVTAHIATRFTKLAQGMRQRGVPADRAAHFLMKLMFCMFAEDIGLLNPGLFTRTVTNARSDPARLSKLLGLLFRSMEAGEPFGPEDVFRFNGGLFADADVVELTRDEVGELLDCAHADWSQVEPSVFGTLFERCLDPDNRTALGAHYTSRDDINTLLDPVLNAPLRREWDAVRAAADALWEKARKAKVGSKPRVAFERCVNDFVFRLAHATVLDPACGSGNFLYVALNILLDLEKEVLTYLADKDQRQRIPVVRPTQLRGIERNPYARELAQVVIWIGYHQWMKFNGFLPPLDPVLEPMDNIERRDAILDLSDPAHPKEPDWPDAEFIVGNPPFLGDKKMRGELGDEYVDALRQLYEGRLPGQSDLCCYWFEKARAIIKTGGHACWPDRNPRHPRWRKSHVSRSNQAERRHFLCLGGSRLDSRRGNRSRQHGGVR